MQSGYREPVVLEKKFPQRTLSTVRTSDSSHVICHEEERSTPKQQVLDKKQTLKHKNEGIYS